MKMFSLTTNLIFWAKNAIKLITTQRIVPENVRVHLSSASYQQPQSYMQFEQPIENVQRTYTDHHPIQSTEKQYYTSESLSNPSVTDQQQLSVDVLINHPMVDTNIKEQPQISNIQYEQLNIHKEPSSSTTELAEDHTSTTRSHFRRGGRIKTRTRTTTSVPSSSTSFVMPQVKDKDEEFYGFIRAPNFNKPKHIHHAQSKSSSTNEPKLYSSTYVSTTRRPLPVPVKNENPIQYESQPQYPYNIQIHPNSFASSTPNVEFIGKIQPKYLLTTSIARDDTVTSTTEFLPEKKYTIQSSEVSSNLKPKIRARMRIPSKKLYSQRGSSHFKSSAGIKNTSEDEDVEGGNYPASFFKAQEVTTQKSKFQITIDPDDQIPYSSIYHPQVIKSYNKNDRVVMERKVIESQESQSNEYDETISLNKEQKLVDKIEVTSMTSTNVSNSSDEVIPTVTTTLAPNPTTIFTSEEEIDEITTSTEKPKRRGTWRLVKRPVDPLEGSESQNIGSVILNNNFILETQKNKKETEKQKFSIDKNENENLFQENKEISIFVTFLKIFIFNLGFTVVR